MTCSAPGCYRPALALCGRYRERLAGGRFAAAREFVAGVGGLGHGLVREIYALNDTVEIAGLRTLLRHTAPDGRTRCR